LRGAGCCGWCVGNQCFDTLKYANTLKAAGIAPEQAEAQAVALSDVLEVNLKDLVTREYLDTRLVQLEQRMTIKLGTMMAAFAALIAAIVKLL
jgi:hypothetical protein